MYSILYVNVNKQTTPHHTEPCVHYVSKKICVNVVRTCTTWQDRSSKDVVSLVVSLDMEPPHFFLTCSKFKSGEHVFKARHRKNLITKLKTKDRIDQLTS